MPGLSDFLDNIYQDPTKTTKVASTDLKQDNESNPTTANISTKENPTKTSEDLSNLFPTKQINGPITQELFVGEDESSWKRSNDSFFVSNSHSSGLRILDKIKNIHLLPRRSPKS